MMGLVQKYKPRNSKITFIYHLFKLACHNLITKSVYVQFITIKSQCIKSLLYQNYNHGSNEDGISAEIHGT